MAAGFDAIIDDQIGGCGVDQNMRFAIVRGHMEFRGLKIYQQRVRQDVVSAISLAVEFVRVFGLGFVQACLLYTSPSPRD